MSTEKKALKAPFPYFGGKSRAAALVWSRLGDVSNYIEPFFGSGAVLLARPTPPKIETVNDKACHVANFWRAVRHDPEKVADHCDWPVSEVDLHARHRRLVTGEEAARFRERMRSDPDYYDAKFAGWWVWGACCWIGSGWCDTPESSDRDQLPDLSSSAAGGRGINRTAGTANLRKRPRVPIGSNGYMPGVLNKHNRPQLADAYDVGRGVNARGELGTCEARRAWLIDWFRRLQDRLRLVRVCCGDWKRVCGSPSVTTRLGVTGVFLDPPYGAAADRTEGLYAEDSLTVADEVRAWCLARGGDPMLRIALCGYAGEHDVLEEAGWEVVAWDCPGGYGNRSAKGKANAKKERIWFSPHCRREPTLFDGG